MNLSSHLFDQIVTSLSTGEATTLPGVTPPTREQRRGPRFAPSGATRVRLIPLTDTIAPAPFDVPLRDDSPAGVGFLHCNRLGLDEQFVLLLPSEDGEVAILCGVAYWQPLGENLFAIGAKFNRVLRQGSAAPVAPLAA
jgi:hypothetical protein